MHFSRRQFVAGAAAAAAATLPDTPSSRAMEQYLRALTDGPDTERDKFENGHLMGEVKRMFAQLINAKPSEIGFTPSTQTGENIVLEGLDVMAGGNVVTNDLHYGGSLLNYRERRKQGLDVRIVANKDY